MIKLTSPRFEEVAELPASDVEPYLAEHRLVAKPRGSDQLLVFGLDLECELQQALQHPEYTVRNWRPGPKFLEKLNRLLDEHGKVICLPTRPRRGFINPLRIREQMDRLILQLPHAAVLIPTGYYGRLDPGLLGYAVGFRRPVSTENILPDG